jgi:hypothetical protein
MTERAILRGLIRRSVVVLCLMTCIAGISISLKAQDSKDPKFRLSPSIGYAVENFDWSIAGQYSHSTPVNILSELKWKKLSGAQFNLHSEYNFWKGLSVRAGLSRTMITSGKVTDTDFGKDNRKDTLFHDKFNSDEGNVTSYHLAVAYKIALTRLSITPFIGYGNDLQSLYLLRAFGNVQGDLRSTYRTKWNGMVAGADLRIALIKDLFVRSSFTGHQVSYSAKANWNLVDDFKHPISFRHHANGLGFAGNIGIEYVFNKTMSLFLTGKKSWWTTGKGTDTLYRENGEINVTQLNPVHRNNMRVEAGAHISF